MPMLPKLNNKTSYDAYDIEEKHELDVISLSWLLIVKTPPL